MKKISNYFFAASVFVMASMPAFAESPVCGLIKELKGVINILRTLAFVGAACVLMDWAWGFIQKGEVGKDDLKNKGIGMLVGFFILFGVGFVLQFVGSTGGQEYFGCVVDALKVK